MGAWKPFPVVGGAYSDTDKTWSAQECINYIPSVAERQGTRSQSILRGAPGLVDYADLGTSAPVRGTHDAEGRLFAVSGQTLFQVTGGVPREIGTIPGVGRVSMAHNQITGGNEIAIANGQSGYVYNTVTETLAQITDDGFPGAVTFDYIDSYIVGVEPGGRFAFTSALADATSYNTLDRYEAEGSPDRLVGQIVTHREWWLCGGRTIEPYGDTGATEGTFQRSGGTVIEFGIASPFCIVNMDDSVFWLGNDGVVYRADGYTPHRISTDPIDEAISGYNTALAFAFVYEDRGHKIFYITFPDGMTFGYDAATQDWHRRKSRSLGRWRINTLTRSNGQWVAGDYSNGKLYTLDWDTQSEAGVPMERRRVTGVVSDNQNRVMINALELVIATGQKRAATDGSTVDVRYSKDGGHNWSAFRRIAMGKTGDFIKRVQMRRFGMARQWVFDVRVTDPVRADLMGASIMAEGATD